VVKQKTKQVAVDIYSATDKEILATLKSIGYLDDDFQGAEILLNLCLHENKEIRYYAINNLAKLADDNLLGDFKQFLANETTSRNRMEIASAIGRMRSKKAIKTMIGLLDDPDPNVILQAIRGLLVFRNETEIMTTLKNLHTHNNELVRKIIDVEFFDLKDYAKNHAQFPDELKNKVVNGDSLNILKEVEDESVHLTFTSPPYYNARDYSIYNSYESYLAFLKNIFQQVHRVTKEGRFFILNTSPIIIPRMGRKYSSTRYPIPYDLHRDLVKMGWEFIDDIIWVKPEPSAKNRIAGFEMHRKPLAYKPNCVSECVMVYRKKSNKLIDWVYDQYPKEIIEKSKVDDGYETSNIWKIDPASSKIHSAVFPLELCDRVIKYFSFEGDLIMDPFAGSGSVGVSAINNNRNYFLIEKDKLYFDEIQRKLMTRLL